MGLGEIQARNLARPEIRAKLVPLIRKAKVRDRAAAAHLADAWAAV
jgi:hypothetical protein